MDEDRDPHATEDAAESLSEGDPTAGATGASLAAYRAKRNAAATPEPVAAVAPGRSLGPGGLFVVQLHDARRRHYDLRLEIDGVLRSWAVPKGISADPADKHLAVQTENHPLEYADFEGVIPAGNYGAGAMIVWDRGRFVPLADLAEGERKGKLLFEFHGHKLRGTWTLVRTTRQSRSASPGRGGGAAVAPAGELVAEELRDEADRRGEPGLRFGGASEASPPGTEWLLIKERDGWVRRGEENAYRPESVLSGLTVEQLAAGVDPAAAVCARLAELGVARRVVDPGSVEVMLAETAERAFDRDGWLFEPKIDGFRLLAAREEGRVRLIYRSGHDATAVFPDLARAVGALRLGRVVLDGEVAVLDAAGRPSFQRLQRRTQLTRKADIERTAVELPAVYFAFDLLGLDDFDLRALPLAERKALLAQLLPPVGVLRLVEAVPTQGAALFAAARELGLEGVVGKRAASTYQRGRSADWVKVRVDRTGDFAVVGWNEGSGRGMEFGGLHVAARGQGSEGEPAWIYVGSVGSGLTSKRRAEIHALLAPTVRPTPPVSGGLMPSGKGHTWVEPRFVVEVRFKELTADLRLRQPVLLRWRDDKPVAEAQAIEALAVFGEGDEPAAADRGDAGAVEPSEEGAVDHDDPGREGLPAPRQPENGADADPAGDAGAPGGELPPGELPPGELPPADPLAVDALAVELPPSDPLARLLVAPERSRRRLRLSNLDKVFWPEDGFTKGHLLGYYQAIARWLLPYLADRPLVLDRYPDGIHGKSFYQKNAPEFAAKEIRTVSIWSEGSTREIEYFLCADEDDLLSIINLGTIPLHVWSSRVGSLGKPDWCILDLDPKGAPMRHVVEIALALRRLTEAIGWPSFVKTSGSSGLHVLLPLGRQCTYEQSRQLGELLARLVQAELPQIATIVRLPANRGGRVYLDFLQNGHGRLLVSPFSVRPLPGAPVSTPLAWDEVVPDLDLRAYNIASVPERMARLGRDLLAPVLATSPDLPAILERLAAR
jgi:bifunctional non-homologous end joining protein LigD